MDAASNSADGGRDTRGMPTSTDAPVEELRTAREALRAAQEAVMGAAQELAEVLRSATSAQPSGPADAYTQVGDEVAAVLRSAAAESSAVRDEAEAVAKALKSKASEEAELSLKEAREKARAVEAEALAERQQASTQAADLRRSGFEGNPHDEDVADPIGMPQQTYDAVAWEIDEWCVRLVEGLFEDRRTSELEWAPSRRIPVAPPRPDALPGA